MKEKRSHTAKAAFSALGKSVLYLLFFLAMQLLVTLGYAIAAALRAVLAYGGADTAQSVQMFAESVLTGASAITLIADLFAAFSLLLWFRLRHKRLSEAAGLCRCSMWTVGFCAFGAVGMFVLVSLVLSLLPERWMAEYNAVMELTSSSGIVAALSIVVAAPLAEEIVFRGIIQSRLERAMPVWMAVALQAALFGLIHGTPIQIGYAFLIGLLFGALRCCTGSILSGIVAHAVFNAMNDPLGLLGDAVSGWQFSVVMLAVCAAGCFAFRRGLAAETTEEENTAMM